MDVSGEPSPVSTSGTLRINDRAKILKADGAAAVVVNRGTQETEVGVDARVGKVFSGAGVFLRERSLIAGDLTTTGTVTRQNGVTVTGITRERTTFPLVQPETFMVTFPGLPGNAHVMVEPDGRRSLEPGSYGVLSVKSRGRLTIGGGNYYFHSVYVEPDAEIMLDNNLGPVQIFVRDQLSYRGRFLDAAGRVPRPLIGYFGSQESFLGAPFFGTVVSPNAPLTLNTLPKPFTGRFVGRSITIHQDAEVRAAPDASWLECISSVFERTGPWAVANRCRSRLSADAEALAEALRTSNAPVYDKNGMLCVGVPAAPPPSPNCRGLLSCPTPNAPPSQCELLEVRCPDYVCPSQPPQPDPTPPPAPEAYRNERPPVPSDITADCEWPSVELTGLDSEPNSLLVAQRTKFNNVSIRIPRTSGANPVGCFALADAGLPEPIPSDAVTAGWRPDMWKRLTPAERAFVKKHPKVAFDFYLDSLLAKRETQRLWRNETFRDVNGPENAFQHAFWNALMAWGHGATLAKEFADAHENFPNNVPDQKAMDLFNNEIGRQIGSGFTQWSGNAQVSDAVYQACIVQKRCQWLTSPQGPNPPR